MITLNVDFRANTDKLLKDIEERRKKALFAVSKKALNDCNECIPTDQGQLRESADTASKFEDGLLVWATPYARYQYYGYVMVDPDTGSPWARKGVKKVLTDRPIQYGNGGTAFWAHKTEIQYATTVWQDVFAAAMRGED